MILYHKLCNSLMTISRLNRNATFTYSRSFCTNNPSKIILNSNRRSINQIQNRSFFKFFKNKRETELREIDKISEEFNLIYINKLNRTIYGSHISAIALGILICCVLVVKYDLNGNISLLPEQDINEVLIYITCFCIFYILIQRFSVQCPQRIYNLPEHGKYLFICNGNTPFSTKQMLVNKSEIKEIKESGIIKILPWSQNRYRIKDDTFILFPNYFRKPADLHVMLGIQEYSGFKK